MSPEAFDGYRGSEQNRRRHATELQTQFVVVPSARGPLQSWQAGWQWHAIENDRLAHLADLAVEECRRRRIILPPPRTLERLCVEARYRARREVERRLTDGLSAEQRQRLDALRSAGRKPVRAGSPGCARCRRRRSLS